MADDETPTWLRDWQKLEAELQAPPGETTIPAQDTAEEKHSAGPEKGNADNNDQRGPSADFAALIDAIGREGQANRTEEKREDRGKRFREYLTLFFIIATTAGVFYQAHIFSEQRDEMHTASEQTTQLIGNNAKLADAAADQAKATDKEAAALADNAKVAHDNMIASERAWVGPTNASIDGAIQVGKELGINIEYANTGKEPANNFVPSIDGFTITSEEDTGGKTVQRLFTYFQKCQIEAPSIVAGQVVFPTTGFTRYNYNSKIPAESIDQDFIDGKKTLIVQGCFVYVSFSVIRHTYFCFFYKSNVTKQSNLNICQIGHYAD